MQRVSLINKLYRYLVRKVTLNVRTESRLYFAIPIDSTNATSLREWRSVQEQKELDCDLEKKTWTLANQL